MKGCSFEIEVKSNFDVGYGGVILIWQMMSSRAISWKQLIFNLWHHYTDLTNEVIESHYPQKMNVFTHIDFA